MRNRGAWILAAGVGISPAANADNKLFITDVLDPGQMETQETLRFSKTSQVSFTFPSGSTGGGNRRTIRFTASLGGGVAEGFQVDASIPYAFVDKESNEVNGVPTPADHSGIGDLDLGFKYRLAGTEQGSYVTTARLDIKPQTADMTEQGTGATSYTLELATSFRVGQSLRPFGFFDATYRTNGQGDSFVLGIGAEEAFSEKLTATLEASAVKNAASHSTSGYDATSVSLSVYLQTLRNLYLIPALGYTWYGEIPGINGFATVSKQTVKAASLGLYYLF